MNDEQPEATVTLKSGQGERDVSVPLHLIPGSPEEAFSSWVKFFQRHGNGQAASEDKARRLMTGEEIVIVPGAARTFADLPALPQRTDSGSRNFDPGCPFPWAG